MPSVRQSSKFHEAGCHPCRIDAPCQITQEQVDIRQLEQLQPRHHSVLLAMHRHGAFASDAWQALQYTMNKLAADIAAAPSAGTSASHDSAHLGIILVISQSNMGSLCAATAMMFPITALNCFA